MKTLNKVVFAVLNTNIYIENTNAYRRKKKQKKLPELSRSSVAKECTNRIIHGNINSNLLALELAAKPQL